jgi:GTPase SAR1 family protein
MGSSKDEAFELELLPFDASAIKPDSKVLVVGQSGSGKTAMMQYILYCLRDQLDICIVFCPTRDTREEYEKFIQKCFVYPTWDVEHLDRICNAQILLSKRQGIKSPGGTITPAPLYKVGIIIDDCLYNKKDFSGESLRYLLMNGRHENFFSMIGAQYVVDFPKSLRSQINLAVVFPEANAGFRDALRNNILGTFDNDKQLQATFGILQQHEALVVDLKAHRERKPAHFFCKAKYPLPRFRVGCERMWQLYYKHLVRKNHRDVDAFIEDTLARAMSGVPAATGTGKGKKRSASGPGGGACLGGPSINVRRADSARAAAGAKTPRRTPKPKPPALTPLAPIQVPLRAPASKSAPGRERSS